MGSSKQRRGTLLAAFAWLLTPVLTFNLDLRYPLVYHSQIQADYFGYSVALHSGGRNDVPRMFVGAPRRNDTTKEETIQPGVLLECPLKKQCTQFSFNAGTAEPRGDEIETNSMLGLAQDVYDGRFVSCAPRWSQVVPDVRHNMFGNCYWGKTDDSSFKRIQPLTNDSSTLFYKIPGANVRNFPYFVYGQAGIAAHFPSITKGSKMLVLGAPGIFNWKGSTVLYRDSSSRQRIRKRAINANEFSEGPIIHNPYKSKDIKDFSLFGYAVTSGRFFSRVEILHAAGAPRSSYVGQVFVYAFPEKNLDELKIHQILQGDQHGEYFGAALAACDLNGDGLDDLVVGAPLFAVDQDEGRALIYLSRRDMYKLEQSDNSLSEIRGTSKNGRFGTSISCIGDMDRDGFNDVAIAAPYEDAGVVYIYRGSQNGLSSDFQQRIAASDLSPSLNGFGISISRGQDVDGNGYLDLAIGAYRSSNAVILRSRPVVQISAQLFPVHVPIEGLPRSATKMQLRTCPSYSGVSLPESIDVIQKVELDTNYGRLFIDSKSLHISKVTIYQDTDNNDNCQDLNITLKQDIVNYLEPLSVSVAYELIPENDTGVAIELTFPENNADKDKFCSTCPVMKPGSQAKFTTQVMFATECGNDNICRSNVTADIQFVDFNSSKPNFIIGSSHSMNLRVSVTNSLDSDPAYNTKVEVTVPVSVLRHPLQCQLMPSTEEILLSCLVGNPLNPGASRDFDLELDMSSIPVTQRNLKFSAKVLTSSLNYNEDIEFTLLPLRAVADITVSGKSVQEQYLFDTTENAKEKKANVSFSIKYQVEKLGFSPIDVVMLLVNLPVATRLSQNFVHFTKTELFVDNIAVPCIANGSGDTKIQNSRRKRETAEVKSNLSPVDRTLFVNCSSGEWECTRIQCRVGPFHDANTLGRLELAMQLDIDVLEPFLEHRDIISFGTDAHVIILEPKVIEQPEDHKTDSTVVVVTFHGHVPEVQVAPWVIIVSVIGGVLLLLLAILALVKCGFFKRTQKENLEKLKRETQLDMDPGQPLTVSDTE